jgi:hypothetical protein
MRLYHAKDIGQYIEQLEKDVEVLKEIKSRYDNGIYNTQYLAELDRDSIENHGDIMNKHWDDLRVARNKHARSINK